MKIKWFFAIIVPLVFLLPLGLFDCEDGTVSVEKRQDKSLKEVEPAEKILEMLHDLCDIAGYGVHSGIQTQPKADQAANYNGTPLTIGGAVANHVYENPGTYTLTMSYTDTEKAKDTATHPGNKGIVQIVRLYRRSTGSRSLRDCFTNASLWPTLLDLRCLAGTHFLHDKNDKNDH